jgi:hypothetical protein
MVDMAAMCNTQLLLLCQHIPYTEHSNTGYRGQQSTLPRREGLKRRQGEREGKEGTKVTFIHTFLQFNS